MDSVIRGFNILEEKAVELTVQDGIISKIKEIPESQNLPFLCPGGVIDTQVNGYLGHDYSSPDFKWEEAEEICKALIEEGTLQHFATIVTRPQETILRNIKAIVKARENSDLVRRSLTGIHIEGNFISDLDGPRGAHDKRYVRKASIEEFDQWLSASDGLLKYITVGAESEDVISLIKHAVSCGVVASLGHTGATKKQIDQAVEAGASVSTHLGNGIWQSLDRFENPIWAQLRNPKLTASIIADLCHVTPDLLWIISRCKDSSHIILVSDLAPCAGLPKGRLKWGDMDVEIVEDKSVRLAGTPFLAGAGSPLFKDVFNFSNCTSLSLSDSFKLATINPCETYNLDKSRLTLKEGKRAEFVLFDKDGGLKTVYPSSKRPV